MKKFTVGAVDMAGVRCKNVHLLNTIEMYFSVNMDDEFFISYNFHSIDFSLWEQVEQIHIDEVEDIQYSRSGKDVKREDIKAGNLYYSIIISSSDFNLYRNIHTICFLERGSWNNMNEMMRKHAIDK